MNHLDLFSGIGGFSLAAQRIWNTEHNIIAFIEQNKYCHKILKKHWPHVPIFNDIRSFNGEKYTGAIDLLTGGFPCQPFSVAGKQKGKEDDRHLWPEMVRVIQETEPTWIIGENVTGIIHMELDNCTSDLEDKGYEVQTFIIPACGVDARHRRDRMWIVANSRNNTNRTNKRQEREKSGIQSTDKSEGYAGVPCRTSEDVTNSNTNNVQGIVKGCNGEKVREVQRERQIGFQSGTRNWSAEPDVGRVAHGISYRVDRLKGLGNAIVPQVVMPIMQCIKELTD